MLAPRVAMRASIATTGTTEQCEQCAHCSATTLTTLPVEVLSIILTAADGAYYCAKIESAQLHPRTLLPAISLVLPAVSLVCHAFHAAARSLPALRCKDLRIHLGIGIGVPSQIWSSLLLLPKGPPTVLDLQSCDVGSIALATWAERASLMQPPIRGLALHKCHSISTATLPSVLLRAPNLLAFVCTSQLLGASAMEAIARLSALRLLCLAECTVAVPQLLSCMGRLRVLRCLLLGGARLVPAEPKAAWGPYADGTASAAPSSGSNSLTGVGPRPLLLEDGAADAAASDLACGPQLRVLEVTFLPASEVCALAAAGPRATILDLCCGDARELRAGLATLRSVLFDESPELTCEGAGCIAETALSAALSARCHGFNETPLHRAAIEGDAPTAALLLEHGAAPNLKDAKGSTPLLRAVFWGRTAVVDLLINSGRCDLEAANHAAETPAYLAALRGHSECLRLLLAADTRVTAFTPHSHLADTRATAEAKAKAAAEAEAAGGTAAGGTAAGETAGPKARGSVAGAVAGADAASCDVCPRPGAMPSACAASRRVYHDGYTPLHAAVISRSLECVRLLLAMGFDPSAQNKYQQSALHIAARLGAPAELVKVLLAHGCDVGLRDERGQTAHAVAKAKGFEHLLVLLHLATAPTTAPTTAPAKAPACSVVRVRTGGRSKVGNGAAGITGGRSAGGAGAGDAPEGPPSPAADATAAVATDRCDAASAPEEAETAAVTPAVAGAAEARGSAGRGRGGRSGGRRGRRRRGGAGRGEAHTESERAN